MRGDKLFRRAAVIAAISMLPSLATAAGLGKINVLSALGQPLLAEIDLVSVSAEDFPSLAAKLASQDAYREANVEYPNGLGGFRFVIEKRANGQPYLKVVTNQPINEPFLDLLIELNWASGRLLREYPVLLDPPGYNVAKPQAPTVTPPQAATPPRPQTRPAPSAASQPAPSEPPTAASLEKPSKGASAKATGEGSDVYGPIRSGETLRQIAESTRQADVSLEQMLVALYRENKGAFISRNMNRLKTGMILKVPTPSEAATIGPQSAKREVIAQTADWNAYRKRLASAATQGKKSGQTATGSIDTKITDEAAPPDSGKDVLKLSKGQAATGKAAATSQAGQEKLNSLQEELVTRDKALEDARARIALLENEIAKMRQLLELKGTPLPADKPPVMTKTPDVPTAVVTPPVEPMAPKPAVVPEPPPPNPDVTSTPAGEEPPAVPKKPKRVTPPPPPPEQPGFLDGLLENPLIPVAGAAILALLGLFGYKQFRKRKDAQLGAFTATGAIPGGFKVSPAATAVPATLTPDAGNSSFLSDFDKVGAGNIDTDEVDPVAEADVYIAYGRDAQAEEILKEANAKDPTRYEIPLKLLEIYSNRKSAQSFETVAKQLHGTIGTQHPLWSKVAEMGRKLDATNSLYAPVTLTSGSDRSGESSVIRAITGAAAADKKPIEQVPAAMRDTLTVKEPVIENAPLDLDLDFDATPTASNSAAASSLSPNTAALDFDLGEPGAASSGNNEQGETPSSSADPFVLDFDLDAPSPTPANRDGAAIGESTAMADIGLDFDLDIGLTSEKQMDVPLQAEDAKPHLELGSSVDLPPLDLSDIDLNLGSSGATNAAMAEKAGGNWQSAETKLDLARAYLEIGDKVGAVEILQEVIKEGSTEQQEEAKKLAAQA